MSINFYTYREVLDTTPNGAVPVSTNEDVTCPVMYEPLAKYDRIVRLSCTHLFSSEAIRNTIQAEANRKDGPKCPVCRRKIGQQFDRLKRTDQEIVQKDQTVRIFRKCEGVEYVLRSAKLKKIVQTHLFRIIAVPFNALHWAAYGISRVLAEIIKHVCYAVDGILIALGVLLASAIILPLSPLIVLAAKVRFANGNVIFDPVRSEATFMALFVLCAPITAIGAIILFSWGYCYRTSVLEVARTIAMDKPSNTPSSILRNSLVHRRVPLAIA